MRKSLIVKNCCERKLSGKVANEVLSFSDYAGISFEDALGLMIMRESFSDYARISANSTFNKKFTKRQTAFSHNKFDTDYFHSTAMPNWPLIVYKF